MPPKGRGHIIERADFAYVEEAVVRAYDRAVTKHGEDAANEAVREMLIALLAAAIITPANQAAQRAAADASRLREIVSAALPAAHRPG